MEQIDTAQSVNQTDLNTANSQIPNKKSNFLLILGILVLLFGVGIVSYYLGMRNALPVSTNVKNNTAVIPSSQTNQSVPVENNDSVTTPQDNTFTNLAWMVENKSEFTGDETYEMDFSYPKWWKVTQGKNSFGCEWVTFESDQLFKLNITNICQGYSAKSSKVPADAATIKKIEDAADDGSTVYQLRYFDKPTNTFKYVSALVSPDSKLGDEDDQMLDALNVTHDPPKTHRGLFLNVEVENPAADREAYLEQIDFMMYQLKLK